MTDSTCKIEYCATASRARGLCVKHYDAWRRGPSAPECKVEGCGKRSSSSGYCGMHYQRVRKTGDINGVALVHNDPDRRFREFYKITKTGCWHWTGHIENNGYARFTIGDERTGAHRWSYERFIARIPDGLTIDHLCRNRACVNPEHLEPVTAQVNLLRGDTLAAFNAAKTHCLRGHPFSGSNLVIAKSGSRVCRECRNMRARERSRRLSRARTKS